VKNLVSYRKSFYGNNYTKVLKIDWSKGFKRHWNGKNAAVTNAFNTLSFLFPQAERFFIDIAHNIFCRINVTNNPELVHAVKNYH